MNARSLSLSILAAVFSVTFILTATRNADAQGQRFDGPLFSLAHRLSLWQLGPELFNRDIDDPFDFSDYLIGDESRCDFGGWMQSGYYTQSTGLFNRHPDAIRLSQGWVYLEKSAAPREGRRIGIGGRIDLVYGTDAQDVQSFGNPPGTWDYLNGWDFGIYGWALPQFYGEIATENFSLIAGHFFTLVGYEVVPAPDNFFFSHSYTLYNSEPFIHTGVLGTFSVNDRLDVYAGWTLGWDTGFNNVDQGNNFLGGFAWTITDNISFAYINTIGNFGARSAGSNGYGHSCVFDVSLGDKWNYVCQSDLLSIQGTNEDNIGVNQYLFYSVNERWGLGCRFEWWSAGAETGFDYDGQSAAPVDQTSYYEVTAGINFNVTANCRLRPEFRYDWSPALDYDQAIWAVDWVTIW